MSSGFLRSAVVLGLITAVGPFAIDMYLPVMPDITSALSTTPAAVQMTLMVFFVVVGLFQLVYGPLADIYGRKAPIYGGLALFTIGSVGCALAPDIETLIGFRVVQALGACAGMVVPRAIIRDLHTGPDATRLMALLMLVVSVSPILAPLAGTAIIQFSDWRGIFWAITATAIVALALTATMLDETHPPEKRGESSWRGSFAAYWTLLFDRPFMSLTFVSGLGLSSFFIYLSASPYVLQEHFGLTKTEYSLFFAMNAIAFIGSSQFTGKLTARFGLMPVIKTATTGFAVVMAAMAALVLGGADSLWVMAAGLFVGYAFLGQILPTAVVLSMEEHGAMAGVASALMGALQMVIGAVAMALANITIGSDPRPMAAGIGAVAVLAWLVSKIPVRAKTA